MEPRFKTEFPNSIAPWLQGDWDIRGTGNFAFGGTGTGLLLVAAGLGMAGVPGGILALLATAMVCAGLTCVMLKIGRPFRAMNVVRNLKTSWMTREALVAGPLIVAGGLAAISGWLSLVWLAAAVGVVFLYCQGMILVASKGIPAWRTPKVLPLIMATGIAEGAGVALIAAPFVSPDPVWEAAMPIAMALLLAGVAARILTWRTYRKALGGGNAPDNALKVLDRAEKVLTYLGHVVPVLLVFAALLSEGMGTGLGMIAGGLVFATGWHIKWIIVNKAAFNQGFAIVMSPARGGGKPGPGAKPGWS